MNRTGLPENEFHTNEPSQNLDIKEKRDRFRAYMERKRNRPKVTVCSKYDAAEFEMVEAAINALDCSKDQFISDAVIAKAKVVLRNS